MNVLTYWIFAHPWAVGAACDVVTGFSLVGMAVLIARRPRRNAAGTTASPGPAEPRQERRPEPLPEPQRPLRPQQAPKTPEYAGVATVPTVKRAAVDRALAALDRWESTYRAPSRGLDELSRLAQKRRADRPRVTEPRSS